MYMLTNISNAFINVHEKTLNNV